MDEMFGVRSASTWRARLRAAGRRGHRRMRPETEAHPRGAWGERPWHGGADASVAAGEHVGHGGPWPDEAASFEALMWAAEQELDRTLDDLEAALAVPARLIEAGLQQLGRLDPALIDEGWPDLAWFLCMYTVGFVDERGRVAGRRPLRVPVRVLERPEA
jgi:hypothetical protein